MLEFRGDNITLHHLIAADCLLLLRRFRSSHPLLPNAIW